MVIINKEFISRVEGGSRSKVKKNQTVINDWLYDCALLTEKGEVRRYYEPRLSCLRIVDKNLPFVNDLIELYMPLRTERRVG